MKDADSTSAPAQRRRFQPLAEFLEKADLTPIQFLQLYLRGQAPAVTEIAGEMKVLTADVTSFIVRHESRARAGLFAGASSPVAEAEPAHG